jgi:hypothetical protein
MTKLIKNKGYWFANGKYFDVKINALVEASQTGTDVSFCYNNDEWDKEDWSKEPETPLYELYLQRAKQLREKYKTLILRFSGGSDSTNILKLCVENNIKIDHIVVNEYHQLSGVSRDKHPGSWEKIEIALPFLKQLEQQGVVFHKHEIDISEFFLEIGKSPDWIFRLNAPRLRLVEIAAPRTSKHHLLEQYNSPDTCIISGLDKPWVWCEHDKIWYFSLPDLYPVLADPIHSKMVQEPFYWSADMPELLIKQCHTIKNYFSQRPGLHPKKANETTSVASTKNWLIPLLYNRYYNFAPGSELPYLNVSPKTTHGPYCGYVDFNIEQMPIYQTHLEGIRLADSLIDSRFKVDGSIEHGGIKSIYGKKRWLGM